MSRSSALGLVDHRRAAPVRRAAARDAAREGAAARRARDDGDADSAHAGAHDVRRSRRVGHPRPAARAHAGARRWRSPESRRDEVYAFVRERARRRAARRTSSTRWSRSPRRSTCAPRRRWPTTWRRTSFPAYRVALLHGRLKQDEKDARHAGVCGRRHPDLLVSTTVIEVGDRRAERDGHGGRARRAVRAVAAAPAPRAGSGATAISPYCVLLYQVAAHRCRARARLKALAETTDGFLIAERDLELRGPGDFFGTRQSGLPTLRIGDLLRDHALMEQARREAAACLGEGTLARRDRRARSPDVAGRFGLTDVG